MPTLSMFREVAVLVMLMCHAAPGAEPTSGRAPCSVGRDFRYGIGAVEAQTCTSPSGEYSLLMEPAHPSGYYSAAYRLSSKKQVLWAEDRPYTLREIVVTDLGFVVGFAYSAVHRQPLEPPEPDERREPGPDYFYLVILDPHGTERLCDVTERCIPRAFINAYPTPRPRPYAGQIIVDPGNDRVIAQVAEWGGGCVPPPDWASFENVWRVYSLSTGRLTATFNERVVLRLPQDVRLLDDGRVSADGRVLDDPKALEQGEVVEAVPVPGTPLLLMHALLNTYEPVSWWGRFVVIDGTGKVVWSLDAKDDYTALRDPRTGSGLRRHFGLHPAILRVEDPGRFDLRLFKDNQLASFRVRRMAGDKWTVSELGRVDYVAKKEASD